MRHFTPLLLGGVLLACTPEPKGTSPSQQAPQELDTGTPIPPSSDPCTASRWYADADEDGFGDPYTLQTACSAPDGYVADRTDCDDTDPEARPDQVWYADADGDGYGDPTTALPRCHRPIAHVTNADDCDDTDATRGPDAFWYLDADADGHGNPDAPVPSCEAPEGAVPAPTDCDDTDPFIHPDRVEVCDEIDNNCDGRVDDDDEAVDPFTRVRFYRDDDGDGYGTDESLGMFCLSSDPGATTNGDCDDTDPMVHPGRIEWPDATDQNCDGDAFWHPVTRAEEGLTTTAFDPDSPVIASAGDLTGDGRAELVLGDGSTANATGQVVVVDGTQSRDFTDVGTGRQVWTGASEGDGLGALPGSLVGDMDGDTVADLLLAAPDAAGGAGVIYLVSSGASSGDVESAAAWSWTGPVEGIDFGPTLALGDIDGDGRSDALVGARQYSTRSGVAWVLTGASVGTTTDPTAGIPVLGESAYHELTTSMVRLGDTDGDGVDEVLLGAPGATEAAFVDGRAYRLAVTELLDPALSLADAPRYYGEAAYSRVGERCGAVGDVSGDGYADLVITTEDALAGYDAGTAYLLYGAASTSPTIRLDDADARIANDLGTVTGAGASLWGDVVPVGDLNGDGTDDFALGAAGADLSASYANDGMVAVFLGGARTGDHGTIEAGDVLFFGSRQYSGRPLIGAGDLDEDGSDDLWIGQTGGDLTLRFFSGALFP